MRKGSTAAGPRTLTADVSADVVSSPNVIAPRITRGMLAVVVELVIVFRELVLFEACVYNGACVFGVWVWIKEEVGSGSRVFIL